LNLAETKVSSETYTHLFQLVRQAKSKADLDAAWSEIERVVGIGAEGLGAVSGAVSSAMGVKRAFDAGKPRVTTRSGSRTRRGGKEWFDETATSQ